MKNKILLIIPPVDLYPLGPAYVASVLESERKGYDVYGFNYNNSAWYKKNSLKENKEELVSNIPANNAIENLFQIVRDNQYTYILIGGLVGFFRWFHTIIPTIKGLSPNSIVIMGGGITKDLKGSILFEKLGIDYILGGEAETNLSMFINLLEQGKVNYKEFSCIPGLCWKDNSGAVHKNPTSRFDINKNLVLREWDSLNVEKYIKLSSTWLRSDKTFFPILIGRGCSNVCAFCSPSIGKFTTSDIDNVINEMKYWRSKYDFDFFNTYSEIAFDDDEYTQEFCRRYIDEIGIPWVGQLRTNVNFYDKTYEIMNEANCMFLFFGFESSNDRVLKKMKKNATYGDHIRNLNQARKAGLKVFGNFMFGHLTETAEEIRETFDFISTYDLTSNPAYFGLASIITYPGTGYYRYAEKEGLINDPFQFLLSYSLKAGISDVNIRNITNDKKLNISALNDDDYFDVICSENIKYFFKYYEKHSIKDFESNFLLGENPGWIFSGDCPTCGNKIEFSKDSFVNPLNINTSCDNCYYTAIVDIYKLPEFKEILNNIKKQLNGSKRIVFVGSEIMDLLFNSSIALNYDNIISWYNHSDPNQSEKDFFYSKRQIKLKDLPESKCDTIVTIGEVDCVHQIIGVDDKVQVVNIIPNIYNNHLLNLMKGKKIAIVKSKQLLSIIHHFENINIEYEMYGSLTELINAELFDFVLFDPEKEQISRNIFSMRSQYRIEQIIEPSLINYGGYLV